MVETRIVVEGVRMAEVNALEHWITGSLLLFLVAVQSQVKFYTRKIFKRDVVLAVVILEYHPTLAHDHRGLDIGEFGW